MAEVKEIMKITEQSLLEGEGVPVRDITALTDESLIKNLGL